MVCSMVDGGLKHSHRSHPSEWILLKIEFFYDERSQGKHNSLDYRIFFRIISINCKVYMFKAWHISKMFLRVQSDQISRVDNPYIFQVSFFLIKCAPFLLKIGEDFNIDDYKGKKTWTNESCLYNQFEHIWFKGVFHFENYGFWKCGLNKTCSYLCDRGHECIICVR